MDLASDRVERYSDRFDGDNQNDEEEFDLQEFDRRMKERVRYIEESLKEGGHAMPKDGGFGKTNMSTAL